MPRSDRKKPGTGGKPDQNRSDARKPRSVRFADSEWKLIEKAAARQGIPAGEFARSGALAAAEERIGEPRPAVLSPGHLALIESTWLLSISQKRGYLIIWKGSSPTTCSVGHLGLRRVKPLHGSSAALRPFG